MKTKDLLHLYANDPLVQVLGIELSKGNRHVFAKVLKGSLDAVVAAAWLLDKSQSALFILHDREEAAYFQNDLENLLEKEVLFFPTSYKKPYQFEEIENANVLTRTEVLNKLNDSNTKQALIVTYPEALTEKVINKRWLVENSLSAKVGDKLDLAFIAEVLDSYGFEKNDFVYEAGQYSIRGGIVDIFSFSNQYPYRLEFFGNEIESIRTFNPDTQLSIGHIDHVSILPNIQHREMVETRESFFSFLKKDTVVWAKDLAHSEEVIEKYYQRACDTRTKTPSPVLSDPEVIFENGS
ncbi:MAG: transcription-repair coupling factor, partial [Cytophagales bacterium]|nr:transcription-repair coupling factor [Cytophagales bacterium]